MTALCCFGILLILIIANILGRPPEAPVGLSVRFGTPESGRGGFGAAWAWCAGLWGQQDTGGDSSDSWSGCSSWDRTHMGHAALARPGTVTGTVTLE